MKTQTQPAATPDHLHGNMRKAFKALAALGCPVFVRKGEEDRNEFMISLESASEEIWGEYYELGYPWINPRLEELLKPIDLAVDWENPGCLVVYPS